MKEYKLSGTVENSGGTEPTYNAGGVFQGSENFSENAGGALNNGAPTELGGNIGGSPKAGENLPAKVSVWSKISGFLFQEVDLNKPIVLELTPKEEKVLTEVHDFLFQDVKFPELHDFLFKEITFGKKGKEKA